MPNKTLTEFSGKLAEEISDRKIYDITEISNLIQVRTKFVLRDIMNEFSTEAELHYLKLLDEQSKNRLNSPEYVQLGYKLAAAKQRKSAANRAANNMGREDDYQRLKNFVSDKFGVESLNEFLNEKAPRIPKKTPVYKT